MAVLGVIWINTYSIKMSTEFTPERRHSHCAVFLDNSIIIIGDWCRNEIVSTRVIWSYNLYTEEWREHEIPNTSWAPVPFQGAVAAAIDKTIIIHIWWAE